MENTAGDVPFCAAERGDLERAVAALPPRARAVLVLHDVLGLYPDSPPFAKQYAQLGADTTAALRAYADDVRKQVFPTARAGA